MLSDDESVLTHCTPLTGRQNEMEIRLTITWVLPGDWVSNVGEPNRHQNLECYQWMSKMDGKTGISAVSSIWQWRRCQLDVACLPSQAGTHAQHCKAKEFYPYYYIIHPPNSILDPAVPQPRIVRIAALSKCHRRLSQFRDASGAQTLLPLSNGRFQR